MELLAAGAIDSASALSTATLKTRITEHHHFEPRNLTSTLLESRRIIAVNSDTREKGDRYRWYAQTDIDLDPNSTTFGQQRSQNGTQASK